MNTVTFTTDSGVELTVLLGEASPIITDGYGGWSSIARPKRVGLTRYAGRNPFKQDIAIMFDGWRESISQESRISTLEFMATQPDDLSEPPKITLSGQALKTDLTWVIDPGIDWDSSSIILVNGSRMRAAAVVHLLEFVDDSIITTPAAPVTTGKKKHVPIKKIVTPKGMTLKQIAQIVYGDPDKYMLIVNANPFISTDPRRVIPAGTPLLTPGGNVPTFVVG